jgi:hypothetical protein
MEGAKNLSHKLERTQGLPRIAIETGELLDSCKPLIFSFDRAAASPDPGDWVKQVEDKIGKLIEKADEIANLSEEEMPDGKERALEELTKMISRLEELRSTINRAEIDEIERSLIASEQAAISAEMQKWLIEVEMLTGPVLANAPKALTVVELSKLSSADRSAYFEARNGAIAAAIAQYGEVFPGTTEPVDNGNRHLVEALGFLMEQEQKKMEKLAGDNYDFSNELGTDTRGLYELLYKLRNGQPLN